MYLIILVLSGCMDLMNHQFSSIGYLLTYILGSVVVVEQILSWWQWSKKSSLLIVPQSPFKIGMFLSVAYVLGGVFVVPPGHRALIERLGVQKSVKESGLLLSLPPPFERIHLIDVEQIRTLDVFPTTTNVLCADQSLISLQAVVHFSVSGLPENWVLPRRVHRGLCKGMCRGLCRDCAGSGRPK